MFLFKFLKNLPVIKVGFRQHTHRTPVTRDRFSKLARDNVDFN